MCPHHNRCALLSRRCCCGPAAQSFFCRANRPRLRVSPSVFSRVNSQVGNHRDNFLTALVPPQRKKKLSHVFVDPRRIKKCARTQGGALRLNVMPYVMVAASSDKGSGNVDPNAIPPIDLQYAYVTPTLHPERREG
nr:hypothetical protein CFP56_77348 [Quercus suber]